MFRDPRLRTFFCSRAKNDTSATLSPGSADVPHRSDRAVAIDGVDELATADLGAALGLDHTAGHLAAFCLATGNPEVRAGRSWTETSARTDTSL
jgi:hypothetical protein